MFFYNFKILVIYGIMYRRKYNIMDDSRIE